MTNAITNTIEVRKLDRIHDFDIIHSQGTHCLYQDIITAQSCHKAVVEQFKKERNILYKTLKTFNLRSNVCIAMEWYNYTKHRYKRIIALTKRTKNEIMHYFNVPSEDITIIPNGVDTLDFSPKNSKLFRDEIRKKHNIDDNDVVLIFVGYEFMRKGLRHVVNALPIITEKNVKVLVVGDDNPQPYKKLAIQQAVADKIIFAGRSADIKQYYAASDIFIFPTSYESFSMATLEAVASGLPIIATKVSGTDELIVDGKNGFFIKRDERDIAEKVNQMLKNNLIKQMGREARKTAENYSWEKVAEKIMKLYNEIVIS